MAVTDRLTTILVVDDEQVIRDICARALHEYRVLQAASADEALQLYDQHRIDLLLTDVMMPDSNGLALLEQVKQRDPGAVVVVMTGYSDKDTVLHALRADADDFLDKPVNLLHLKSTVRKALAKKELKEELAALRQLDHLKDAFIARISHKLKTPLTSLSLGLEELERYAVRTEQGNSCYERLASMREDIGNLAQLMSSVIRISQLMVPQRLQTADCDLAEITRSAIEAVHPQQQPALVLELQPVAGIKGNRDQLLLAIQQLVENAFKFTDADGSVTVRLQQQGSVVTISISDTGCGIPDAELTRVFERFYQIDPDATGQVPGFGLGLFCAREVIQRHGGSLSLTSSPGEGTEVLITLYSDTEGVARRATSD